MNTKTRTSTTRYFNATVEGHFRILVVEGPGAANYYSDADEISPSDLPANFGSWREYNAGAGLDYTKVTMSRHGD